MPRDQFTGSSGAQWSLPGPGQGSPPSAGALLGGSPPHLRALLSRGIVPSSPAGCCEVAGMQVMLRGRRARRAPAGMTPCRSGRTDSSPKERPSPSPLPLILSCLSLLSRQTAVSLSSPELITAEMIWVNYVQSPEMHLQPSLRSSALPLPWLFPLRSPLCTCLLTNGLTCFSRKEWFTGLHSFLLCVCCGGSVPAVDTRFSTPRCPGLGRARPGHRVPGEHAGLPRALGFCTFTMSAPDLARSLPWP